MQPFETPLEARQILLALIFEQANQDGVELSDLERRLLASTETDDSVTEAEWDFVINDADFEDALMEKTALLIRHIRHGLVKAEGAQGRKEFKRCLNCAAGEASYMEGVLVGGGFVRLRLATDWQLITILSIVGSVIFIWILLYWVEHNPSSWIDSHFPFLRSCAGFISKHTIWLERPDDWFQSYFGYVIAAALCAFAIYSWPRIIGDYLKNRKR
jgi:hypothetical protein